MVLYALIVCSIPDKLKALMAALSGYLAWRKVMEISGKGRNNTAASIEVGFVVLIFIAYALFSHDNWRGLWLASVIIGGVFLISMVATIYIASRAGVAESGKSDYKLIDFAALMVSFNSFMTLSTTVFGPMLLKLLPMLLGFFGH
ncbi:hypothetical protein HK22_02095 [Gluconobacter sp. DsW_056]|uniref:hypothetical protein n=1 Tax=Gluconobacter sp. DsW_056 TaxID=1511209 RepID=UPI000A3BAFB4|nr:hypothetical protein [Gluconobacter sp. DsW_056]OUI81670.1 hypothetical protein HK22_02095 [Gluconobacter sp. DsW_056]